MAKIVSTPFIDTRILWSNPESKIDKYGYRIKLKFNTEHILRKNEVIPLYEILGYNDLKKGFIIEPYLHNTILIKLPQYESSLLISKIDEKNIQ